MSVSFHNLSIPFSISNEERIIEWVLETFHSETSFTDISLSIIFCTDEELLQVNKDFLNHDYYTDIITFPIEQTEDYLEAELYISIDRVRDNSSKEGVSFNEELHRVIIHGVLHLCGYGDKTNVEISQMRTKESHYISLL